VHCTGFSFSHPPLSPAFGYGASRGKTKRRRNRINKEISLVAIFMFACDVTRLVSKGCSSYETVESDLEGNATF